MNIKILLMTMMKLLVNSRRGPLRIRKYTYDKVLKMCVIYQLIKKRQSLQERKQWVRPIFREEKRSAQGASDNLVIEMKISDREHFVNYFRMSPETFEKLLRLVGPRITKQKGSRKAISPRTRLEVTLRYLASGDSMTSVSYNFRIGLNTISKIVAQTCAEIWNVLKDEVFIKASEESWRKIAEDFLKQWDFPNCIGAIDGKHVVIQAPPNSGSTYYNYKRTHSLNLLAISDANYCFTIVNIGAEGRQSDAGIFRNSGLVELFEKNSLGLPPSTRVHSSAIEFPFVLVGDEAFPLRTYLMRPYPRARNLNMTKKIFNYRLSRARRVVESAFGILVARWRIFRGSITTNISTAKKIIQATTALHNFIIKDEQQLPVQNRQYSRLNIGNENLFSTLEHTNRNRPRNEAIGIRDAYADYFENVNPLPWQWEKALNNNF